MTEAYLEALTRIVEHCEIKREERVLVLAEHHSDKVVVEAIARLARERGGDVSLLYCEPFALGASGEPSETVRQAMFASELAIVCSYCPILYTKSLNEALMEHKVRMVEIFGGMANRGTLSSPGPSMVKEVFYIIVMYLWDKLFGEKEVHLTSRRGTDFTCKTPPGGIWLGDRGTGRTKPLVPGSWQTVSWSGEGVMWPEETGNGIIYFDGFYGTGYSADPIICTIEKGWCTRIESGGPRSKADKLKEILAPYKYNMQCTEFAVGVNPRARIYLREDDTLLIEAQRNCGVVHVALGSGRIFNPPVGHPEFLCRIHLDGTVLDPTVVVGGETLIEDGVPIYLNDPVLRDMVREFGDPDELLKSTREVIK